MSDSKVQCMSGIGRLQESIIVVFTVLCSILLALVVDHFLDGFRLAGGEKGVFADVNAAEEPELLEGVDVEEEP